MDETSDETMPTIRLSRVAEFSAGHRYWVNDLSEDENRRRFGRYASPMTHGHNYRLTATYEGPMDPAHGMVVNIVDLKAAIHQAVVQPLDQTCLNDQVAEFRRRPPTLENLVLWMRTALASPPRPVRLVALKLEETRRLYAEWEVEADPMVTLTRTYEFCAAHRLHVDQLSAQENLSLFGKCNNPAGHGHNYVLEVTVAGEPDPNSGMIVSLTELDEIVNRLVVERYDHKHLNVDVPEFQHTNPTSEAIVQHIFDTLERALPVRLHRVRLHETARNAFEVVRRDG